MNHATETIPTPNAHSIGRWRRRLWLPWRLRTTEGQRPVWPMPIVVVDERRHSVLKMSLIQDQQPVKTLRANRSHKRVPPHHWPELSIAPPASGEAQTFRVTHPFHPLRGRTFQLA